MALNEHLRLFFLVFFATHIPITLLIDAQGLLPPSLFPTALRNLVLWYCDSYKDNLMRNPPLWFRSVLFAELTIQLPLFFFFLYGLMRRDNRIRIPGLMYGSHTATTLVPIIAEFAFNSSTSIPEKGWLIMIYAPYFVIPLLFAGVMIASPPFPTSNKKQRMR